MAIVTLGDITLSFGTPPLISHGFAQIEAGERVVLLGRNGCGKSTLLSCIAGSQAVTAGTIYLEPGIRCGYLPQHVPEDLGGCCYDVVAGGVSDQAELLESFHRASEQVARNPDAASLERLERIQHQVEAAGAWSLHETVVRTLGELGLDAEAQFKTLSGGGQRRTLLARALVGQPELLLLDEPTNHLDIDAIAWLESALLRYPGTLVMVTHDRMMVRKLATRILEIDQGKLTTWACSYDDYVRRKQAAMEAQEEQWAAMDKKIAQEEVWASGGIKARRTRNEGRVRALERMLAQRAERRQRVGLARLQIQEGQRPGDMVLEARELHFSFSGPPLIRDFSTRLVRGDRIGILGPNGSGKTTLLRLLLGELTVESGSVKKGSGLQVAYFDQLRCVLNPEATVRDTVGAGQDVFEFEGKPIHLYAYLDRFLFERHRAEVHVKDLSGGERARLVLAKLFRTPCNLLIMDEPTNDLDIETLELLEQLLIDFQGTLLVVSHDREFMNNVVTSTLVLEGQGVVTEYAGGYDDWLAQRPTPVQEPKQIQVRKTRPDVASPRKLTLREQAELEALEKRIEQLETQRSELEQQLTDPDVYRGDPPPSLELQRRLSAAKVECDTAYERWAELEAVREAYARR